MNRCSFCEWIPILPWPVWPLAGQSLLGQNVVVGSMMVLLALCGSMPRGVYLGPHFRYKCASPRLSAELPWGSPGKTTTKIHCGTWILLSEQSLFDSNFPGAARNTVDYGRHRANLPAYRV